MSSTIWETGTQGPPGPPGPPTLMRLNGNYLQTSIQGTGIWTNLLPLSSITGPAGASVQGPIGPVGPPGESVEGPAGPAGFPGSVIYSGSGNPDNSIGANGDYYVDTASAFFWGPKATGVWTGPGIDLRGGASGVHFGQRSVTNNAALLAKAAAVDPTLSSNSDYTQITSIFEAIPSGLNRGITQQVNSITMTRAGFYEIGFWASMSFSAANANIAFKFAVNGVLATPRKPIVRLDVANNIGSVSARGFANLNVGDILTVWVASSVAGNLKIIDAVFSAVELR